MDYIDIKRPVIIKVIMTEQFREQLIKEAEETLARLDENLKIVQAEGKKQLEKLLDTDLDNAKALKNQLNYERERVAQMKSELSLRMTQLEGAEEGDEFPFRVFEGSVQVKVGDNLMEKVSNTEVLIKDWKVVEIRNP